MRGKSIPAVYFDIGTVVLVVLGGYFGFVTMKENDAKSVGVGIAIMLFGWGMALLCALAASDRKIRQEIDLYAKGLPIDQTCDSDSANEAIVHRLSEIDAAYNVRAFIPELEKTYLSPERVAKYDKAIVDAVRAGVTWADVCSPGFRERSKRLKDATTGLVGRYTVRVLPNSVPLLNFIILRYKDRREEVWIGWSIEPPADAKARTFRITDPDVVAKFMEWHRALLRMAKDC